MLKSDFLSPDKGIYYVVYITYGNVSEKKLPSKNRLAYIFCMYVFQSYLLVFTMLWNLDIGVGSSLVRANSMAFGSLRI